jgi:hypothetical protein
VPATANAAETNGLACLAKYGGARDKIFGNPFDDLPPLLNFRDGTDRKVIEPLRKRLRPFNAVETSHVVFGAEQNHRRKGEALSYTDVVKGD